MMRGLPVSSEDTEEIQGFISDILIHPDTGAIEGFFVSRYSLLYGLEEFFLSSHDVRSIGTMLRIASADMLGDPRDVLRVSHLLDDSRTVLGQKILTEEKRTSIGRLADVQFDTRHMRLEWLFPKKWWISRTPIQAREIVRIEPAAIIVKEPLIGVKEKEPLQEASSDVVLPEIVPTPTT